MCVIGEVSLLLRVVDDCLHLHRSQASARVMTHSYVSHDSFMYVSWLIHMCVIGEASLLLRVVDDFLYISADLKLARAFVRSFACGHSDYGALQRVAACCSV